MPMDKFNVLLWSGGQDSTASLIVAHEEKVQIDLVLMARLWFDKERKIPAESPEHIYWVENIAKPMIESWGYPVEFVFAEKDYLDCFYEVRKNSANPDNIGKYAGFLMAGRCRMCGEKAKTMNRRIRELQEIYQVTEYCGIRIDEKERLKNMHNRKNQVSLLEQYICNIYEVRHLCKTRGLLSPDYQKRNRAGNCWFCPNQGTRESAALKSEHPNLWGELKALSAVENTIQRGFRYGVPFDEVERKVDYLIAHPIPEQLSFDFDDFL